MDHATGRRRAAHAATTKEQERRSRSHIIKSLHAALLLIDFFNPLDFAGAERLAPRAIAAARASVKLRSRCDALGVPAIFINDNFGHWSSEFSRLVAGCMAAGGATGTMAQMLAPRQGDVSVLKPRHSAFFGTPLAFLLDELGIRTLILAGIAADSCVLHTALDAHVRKFSIWVPRDCVASETTAWRSAALGQMMHVAKALTARSATAIRPAIAQAMKCTAV